MAQFNFSQIKGKITDTFSSLFQKNRFENDIQDLIKLSKSRPNDMRVLIKLAETYFRARNIPEAIKSYEKVADTYLNNNFILKAASIYKNILKLDPSRIEYNKKLASLYQKLNMKHDAITQYRIVMQYYSSHKKDEKLMETAQELLDFDPSPNNRRKLAEIYQSFGKTKEASEQYHILAKEYREKEDYKSLLRIYELILPSEPKNTAMIRDVCILYLRQKDPENALKVMERYKVDNEDQFADLFEKSKMLQKALRQANHPSNLAARAS